MERWEPRMLKDNILKLIVWVCNAQIFINDFNIWSHYMFFKKKKKKSRDVHF